MKKPNVLWIFAGQLRHQALACTGDPNARTPNIDRLAREGVTCRTAISNYRVCMPFRAGLMTGQYARVHGCRVHGDILAPETHTVAHTFREAGYRTSYVGKLHLAGTNSYTYCISSPETEKEQGPHFRLLFDNRKDPFQRNNLSGRRAAAELQQKLHQRLCHAVLESGEPLPDFVREGARA